ncbi:MAG: citrate/2-methylcitrate synthase, partial [Planctomycetota bacterium]
MAQQATAAGAAGMAGMVAGETAIAAALQDALLYRGYEIADLAEHATFEEVAFLLLEGHRPDASELDRFSKELRGERGLPDRVSAFLDESGELFRSGAATAMDLLRTGVSILGHVDPECQDNAPEAELNKSKRLLAKIPQMIGRMQASIEQRDAVAPDSSLGHAANLFKQLTRRTPTEREERAFDVSLILYAEHDFNASTFTTRVIAATLSDLHSAIAGGIGALKGPLHGGANEAAIEMLLELREAAGKGDSVDSWMQRAFAEHRKLMGFGHRVYK